MKSGTPFCPFDGEAIPTVVYEEPIWLDEVFENVDSDGNEIFVEWKNIRLTSPIPSLADDDSLITGSAYTKQRIVTYASDHRKSINGLDMIPKNDFTLDDWPFLIAKLEQQNIPFTKRFGIINTEEPYPYAAMLW
jgi:hypothetical protein